MDIEIEADLWDEYREEQEREDANRNAPILPPPTDEELDDEYHKWLDKQA